MRPLALSLLSLFALAFSDPVAAIDPVERASKTNADPATTTSYLRQTPPALTGTIVSTTDHSIVLDTDDQERLTLEYDSRTLLPAEMPVGARVKVEFHVMESGKYHAARVTPIRTASGDIAMGEIRTTYAHDGTGVDAEAGAAVTGEAQTGEAATTTATTQATGAESHAEHEATAGADVSAAADQEAAAEFGDDETLPRTASAQPLIGALGILALAGAFTLWALRRERA